MGEISSSRLYQRIGRLRWQAPLLAFSLVLAHQLVEHTWLIHLPRWQHFATQMLFYGLVGPALAWWALTSLRRSVAETEAAERALQKAHHALSEVNKQLTCLLQVNHRLTEAQDEEALLPIILELPLAVVPALGCSLVRFDERQQPLPALHEGSVATATLETWTNLLAEARIRRQCATCANHRATAAHPCTLLSATPDIAGIGQLVCLELARGSRRYAVLNIYLPEHYELTAAEQTLLEAMAQEMVLALESDHLRRRELDVLMRLQPASRFADLNDELRDVLAHTVAALAADGGVLWVVDAETAELKEQVQCGQMLPAESLVKSLAAGAMQTDSPLVIHDLEQETAATVRSLLTAPLHTERGALGSLVLWSNRPDAFNRRHTQLVAIVAGQAAFLLENHRLTLQGEYRIALAERARLAREIHDGLAQTLGYLKLRATQINGWLAAGDYKRSDEGLAEVRQLLNEAYIDAREAIDGLRLQSDHQDMVAWVGEIVAEFELLSGIPVEKVEIPEVSLTSEAQIQLQRIVQEAFSNIRKHAQATAVHLRWQKDGNWLTLQIADNGRGFNLDDVAPVDRHGLRIMQERAELLNADFQITSLAHQGTEVTVTIPLQRVREVRYG